MRTFLALLGIVFIGFLIYYLGFSDAPPKGLDDIQNMKFKDPCLRKSVEGDYRLIERFEHSDKKLYEKGKMELSYEFYLKKDECTVEVVNGKQISSSIVDSITQKRVVNKRDQKEIIGTGEILKDSLQLVIYVKNNTTQKGKTTIRLPYPHKGLTIGEGTFYEESNNSSGKATIQKINN